MKNLNSFLFISILILYFSCKQNGASDKIKTSHQSQTEKPKIKINKSDKKEITFNDATKMLIEVNNYFETPIDSIVIQSKTFDAEYQYCGKSPLNKDPFDVLKHSNKQDYKNIESITTAHSIVTKNKDTFYISSFANVKCLTQNDIIKISAKIYGIYTNNQKPTNIIIIEDIL